MTITTAAPSNPSVHPIARPSSGERLSAIRQVVSTEQAQVDAMIIARLASGVPRINDIGHYLVNAGGKRIRPLVVLLAGRAANAADTDLFKMAAIIEFIHTATLLHDDVVDQSSLRRGRLTANAAWDNASAVLVGDFVYSRAFQMIAELNCHEATAILANTTNVIAEGEVMQLCNRQRLQLTEAEYLTTIECKTAVLFQAASQLGAVLGQQPPLVIEAFSTYGQQLGVSFQLVDDALDYRTHNPDWGKNLGDDLAEGKLTMPLIYAYQHANPDLKNLIEQLITNPPQQSGDYQSLMPLIDGIEATGAIRYTMSVAKAACERAKAALVDMPDSIYRQALLALADFAIERSF